MIIDRAHPVPSDAELVGRILAGETAMYEMVVERYQERLFRFAIASVRDSDVAADLVQDTLVRAYAGLDGCRERERFGAWLFRILRNRCIDFQKEHRRRDVPLDESYPHAATGGLPDRETERAELRDSLERALAMLPAAQREAFVLKHVHGLAYEEIAVLLDVGISALKMRVARAREALQETLAVHGESRERVV